MKTKMCFVNRGLILMLTKGVKHRAQGRELAHCMVRPLVWRVFKIIVTSLIT